MRINLEELLKRQEASHICKKDEICSICGKQVCELCAGLHGFDFKPVCYDCERKGKELKMENEKKKKGSKNVVSEIDKGDHVLQRRRVEREGMMSPIEYDLKIPKTSKSFLEIYGEGELIRLAVASLKTENDDAIENSGKPISEEKKFKTAYKSASATQKAEIAKILKISIAELETREKVATAENKKK